MSPSPFSDQMHTEMLICICWSCWFRTLSISFARSWIPKCISDREYNGNTTAILWERNGNMTGTQQEHNGNTTGTQREHNGNTIGKVHNGNTNRKIMGTQREHNGNTTGTQLARNITGTQIRIPHN
jgi:hypothetical protein